jgi:hypothetical protein
MVGVMGIRTTLTAGAAVAVVLCGCGSGQKASATTGTSASSSTTAPSTTAGTTPDSWVSLQQLPPSQAAAEKAMLKRDGIGAGAHEDLMSSGTGAASIVEQFRSPQAATATTTWSAKNRAARLPSRT